MTLDLIRLPLPADGRSVAALVYEARRARGVTLVVGHGYSSSKQNLDGLCGFLASQGFQVISVDFPGHKLGASGGELRNLQDCVDSLSAAAQYAKAQSDAPIYAVGHSLGAMTALRLAAAEPSIAGAIVIATGWGRLAALEALQRRGVTDLRSNYVVGCTLTDLMREVETSTEATLAALAGRPVLYIAADRDMMVTMASVRELYDRAPEPKSYQTIESDHTYAGDRARSVILTWLDERYPRAAA